MRSDWLDAAVATTRRVAAVPLALRGVVAATATGAIAATTTPTWDAPDGYIVAAVLAAAASVAVPDSGSGLVFVVAIVVTWLTGAPGGVGPAVVVTALALLAGHVAGALAAAMPVTARSGSAVALRWARPTAAIGALVVAAAALIAVLDTRSRGESAVVTVAALGALTAAAWRWSAPD